MTPPRLLHEFFAQTLARHAERVAVDLPPGPTRPQRRQVRYGELAQQAAALRARLQGLVAGECVVAVLLPRGPELFAAQLAIAAAGAGWTCLEPAQPDAHLAFVIEDCEAAALITDAGGAARARGWLPAERLLLVGDGAEDLARSRHAASGRHGAGGGFGGGADGGTAPDGGARDGEPGWAGLTDAPPPWLDDQSLAYVIYTSGTTGKPKGVLLEHRGIVNLVAADLAYFRLGPDDRVAQGSSAAYDSSVEETWLAFAAGAALVVMDDDTARLGPDLVPWLQRERIRVLCPPPTLLRATGCRAPAQELPDLRLCYVGGEPLPDDLAALWADGIWLENGYGPTECTVTVVRERVQPGRPVGIGWPVAGHRALVLDEQLREVADGDAGELCLSGPGLARGYLDRAELTAAKFVQHERHGRLYRTGDRVRRGQGGELFYLGRLDAQVKLRGHRVELEAIEALLAQCEGVRAAACRVQQEGNDQLLAAFVVAADAAAPPAFAGLRAQLAAALPAAMLPQRWQLLPALPVTVGGKLDRSALPLAAGNGVAHAAATPPRDELERALAAAFARHLVAVAVAVDDDFFDLGGTSLRAAELVSTLRGDPATAPLTVRDVYEARTVAGLAARLRARPPIAAMPVAASAPVGDAARVAAADAPATAAVAEAAPRPLLVTGLQALFLLLLATAGALAAYAVLALLLPWLLQGFGVVGGALLLLPLLLLLRGVYALATIATAVLGKRLLLGRCRAGRNRVYSLPWLRHWLSQRLVQLVPWDLLQGSVLQCAVLRRLGARIGRRVHIHRGVDLTRGGWDLLAIGDDVTLNQDCSVGTAELEAGALLLAPVVLRAGSTLEVRAGVCGDTELGEGAVLAALSSLPRGGRIPAGERWDGVPAAPAGAAARAAAIAPPLSEARHALLLLGSRALQTLVVTLPAVLLVLLLGLGGAIDAAGCVAFLQAPYDHPRGLLLLVVLATAALPATLLANALWLRVQPRAPAACSVFSSAYVRIWLQSGLVDAASNWLSGTLLWPHWLRLAGARIGGDCEISTIVDVLPAQLQLSPQSFLADGIYLGGPRLHGGVAGTAPVRLGRGTGLGHHGGGPPGSSLPDDVLLGVCTVADPARIAAGTDWFGHPPFRLPRREVVACDRRLTHAPGLLRRANRWGWELLRFSLPAVPVLLGALWLQLVATGPTAGAAFVAVTLPLATLATAAVPPLLVLLLKWLLLGRVRPGQHVLWSCWCSRWDFLYVAWNRFARGLLQQLEGTLLLAGFLRLLGMRIGRRAVLGPGFAQVVDPDMLSLGDGCTVDGMFQAHSFEDRVLKIDRVRIGAGASVGRGAVLLYGAEVGAGACVRPHSVVMKHERLLLGQVYAGAPTRPAGP